MHRPGPAGSHREKRRPTRKCSTIGHSAGQRLRRAFSSSLLLSPIGAPMAPGVSKAPVSAIGWLSWFRGVAGKLSIEVAYIKSLPIVFQLRAERAYRLGFALQPCISAPSRGDSNACRGIPHPFGQHGAACRARPRVSVCQIQLENPAASPSPGGRSLAC